LFLTSQSVTHGGRNSQHRPATKGRERGRKKKEGKEENWSPKFWFLVQKEATKLAEVYHHTLFCWLHTCSWAKSTYVYFLAFVLHK
jgi:hypothetical protein